MKKRYLISFVDKWPPILTKKKLLQITDLYYKITKAVLKLLYDIRCSSYPRTTLVLIYVVNTITTAKFLAQIVE